MVHRIGIAPNTLLEHRSALSPGPNIHHLGHKFRSSLAVKVRLLTYTYTYKTLQAKANVVLGYTVRTYSNIYDCPNAGTMCIKLLDSVRQNLWSPGRVVQQGWSTRTHRASAWRQHLTYRLQEDVEEICSFVAEASFAEGSYALIHFITNRR